MRRRNFVLGLGCIAAAWPRPVLSQGADKTYRIAILSLTRRPAEAAMIRALAARGYVEGGNTVIDSFTAEGDPDKLPSLTAELLGRKPDLIIASGFKGAEAAQKATQTIPIVLWAVGNPIKLGFAQNFSRPGGNITGVTDLSIELTPKRMQLLKETVPAASRVAIMWNSADRSMDLRAQEFKESAADLGITMIPLPVHDGTEIGRALAGLETDHPDAIVVVSDPVTAREEKSIIEFLADHHVPSMYEFGRSAKNGALLSYGPDFAEMAPRVADYVDKILKGAKAAELPIEQTDRYYFVVNRKTAAKLGVTVPTGILLRADEVIE